MFTLLTGFLLATVALLLGSNSASAAVPNQPGSWSCDWDGNCSWHAGGPGGYGVNPGIGGPKPDWCRNVAEC